MTVDELIEALSSLPGGAAVMVLDTNSGGSDLYEVHNVSKPEDVDGTVRVWLGVQWWEGA